MPLVLDQPQRVADWVGEHCGCPAPTVDSAIGYVDASGTLQAGVYFDGMLPNTVFAHIASARTALPRSLLVAVCAFAFRQLGVARITFMVDAANDAVVRLACRLGARVEARLSLAYGATDAIMFAFWSNSPWAKYLLARFDRYGAT